MAHLQIGLHLQSGPVVAEVEGFIIIDTAPSVWLVSSTYNQVMD